MSRSAAVRIILAAATIITAAACASPTAPSAQRAATHRLNDGNTFTDSSNTGCFSGFTVGNSGC